MTESTRAASATSSGDRAQLDRRFVNSVAWAGAARLGSQGITWVITLAVARLLSPSDYGVVASATTILGLIRIVTEFGLGTAIVTQRNLSQSQLKQLGGFAALLGLVAAIVATVLALPAAMMLRVPEMRTILPVLGLGAALSTLNALPTALLQRELDYRRLSQLEFFRAMIGSVSLLLFAYLGFGYWSLVLNEIAAIFFFTVALFLRTRYRLAWPQLQNIRSSLQMSAHLVTARFAWYAYSTADIAVVSRRLGKAVLGDYSMAWTLTSVPSEKIGAVIMSVTPGILSRVQQDLPELRRYFLLLIEGLALLLFPTTIGIALTAHEAIPLLLGAKWIGAVGLVQVLGPLLAFRSITPVCSQVLVARMRSDLVMRYTIAAAVIMPVSFLVGSTWGVMGVALAWAIVSPLLSVWLMAITIREIDLPVGQVVNAVARPVVCVVLMALAVHVARGSVESHSLSAIVRLVVLTCVGAVVFLAAAAAVMGSRLRRLATALRGRA